MAVLTRTSAEPGLRPAVSGTGPRSTAPAAPVPAPVELAVPCWTRVAGQVLVALGGLMVAFAAFQLWGTALIEWQAQRALSAELGPAPSPDARPRLGSEVLTSPLEAPHPTAAPLAGDPGMGSADNADPSTVGPAPDAVRTPAGSLGWLDIGDPVGRIDIPAIDLSKAFVEGVDRDVLRQGPGHYPGTALPGHPGNTAIAGHRTTHGAPFYRLDELVPGDEIVLTTAEGEFHYVVDAHTDADGAAVGHTIVTPDDVGVLADAGDDRLTLTACHPRYSARQRIVVTAHLVGPALTFPAPVTSPEAPAPPPANPSPASPAAAPDPGAAPAAAPNSGATPNPGAAMAAAVGTGVVGEVPAQPAPIAATAEELARRQTAVAVPAAMGATGAVASLHRAANPVAPADLGPGLGWQDDQLAPTILWATVCAVVAHAAWIGGRLWRRRWAYGTGAAAFVPCLFVCFVHLDRVLPAF